MDDVLQNNPGSKLDKSGVPSLETATTVDPNPKPAIINLPITSFFFISPSSKEHNKLKEMFF